MPDQIGGVPVEEVAEIPKVNIICLRRAGTDWPACRDAYRDGGNVWTRLRLRLLVTLLPVCVFL